MEFESLSASAVAQRPSTTSRGRRFESSRDQSVIRITLSRVIMTTRVKVDDRPTSRFNLPSPWKDAAKKVVEKQEMIAAVLSKSPMVSAEQFLVAAIAEVNSLELVNPGGVDPVSVVKAVFNAATLGLMFGSTRGHAYLVPFRKSGSDVKLVNLIVGYRGYIELAYRSHFLKDVDTEVILKDEIFRHRMTEVGRRIKHELPIGRVADKGGANLIGAYCLYHTRQGGYGISVVTKSEIDAVKKDSDTWRYSFPAMARKTAIRRAAKNWSLTEQLSAAIHLDDIADTGGEQPLLTAVPGKSTLIIATEEQIPQSSLPPSTTDEPDREPEADGNLNEYFRNLAGDVPSNSWLLRLIQSRSSIPAADFSSIVLDCLSMTDPRCCVIRALESAVTQGYVRDSLSDLEALRQGGLITSDLYSAIKVYGETRLQELVG